jgi:hypothetical protein
MTRTTAAAALSTEVADDGPGGTDVVDSVGSVEVDTSEGWVITGVVGGDGDVGGGATEVPGGSARGVLDGDPPPHAVAARNPATTNHLPMTIPCRPFRRPTPSRRRFRRYDRPVDPTRGLGHFLPVISCQTPIDGVGG